MFFLAEAIFGTKTVSKKPGFQANQEARNLGIDIAKVKAG